MIFKKQTYRILLSTFLSFVFVVAICIYSVKPAIAGTPEEMGKWERVDLLRDLHGNIVPLQSVHTTLLPNGKVLIVNGSSNRNTLIRNGDNAKFDDGVNVGDAAVTNNTALFDPKTGKFKIINSPPAQQWGESNDLFCSGHVHLPSGDLLFMGGSARYYPGEKFAGSKQTNIYDWQNNTWKTPGLMHEGRWYPSPVPLADGKVVIFSGLRDGANFIAINQEIDIYDPATDKLHNIDLGYLDKNPFETYISEYQYIDADGNTVVETADAYDFIDIYPRVFPTPDGKLLITGDGTGKFPMDVHNSNQTYLMSVNEDPSGKLSVSFELGPKRDDISKVFGTAVPDPNDPGDVLLIGGILNTNNINFGKVQLGDFADENSQNSQLQAGGARIAKSLERWDSETNTWEFILDFLDKPRAMNTAVILPNKELLTINGGEYAEYKQIYEPLLMKPNKTAPGGYETKAMNPAEFPRLYHNSALLLPDARVFVIGGNANRAARQPNGTVHVDVVPDSQNYYALAKLTKDPGQVPGAIIPEADYPAFLEDYYQNPGSYFVEEDPNVPFAPAEVWQAEIFSPPYLFAPGSRPVIKGEPQTIKYGETQLVTVENATTNGSMVLVKLGSITHAFDYGQTLADLEIKETSQGMGLTDVTFTAPTNANLYPPGYYMMFYVNDLGKPSTAKMVKLEAA
ncbi:MAG: DUF1929 domain-containing protein [Symploca sp. SIO2B6]|nr:DUF1929 domain-containing protein [Symploca sp. SIO2B6]